MSKAGGLVLIVGGLTVAAYVMARDDDASGSEAARQAEFAKSARVEQRPSQDIAVPMPQPAFRPIASRPAPTAEFAFSAPVVVTVAPRASDAATSPTRAAAIPRDRDTLTRELQKELRRVGCYDGELNGAWTPATRRAMKAFTDRVNASLPVEEPDAVLFTMVQGQQDQGLRQALPGRTGSERGRPLRAQRHSRQGDEEDTAGASDGAGADGQPVAGRASGARDHRLVDDRHGGRARAGAGCCRDAGSPAGHRIGSASGPVFGPGSRRRAHGARRTAGRARGRRHRPADGRAVPQPAARPPAPPKRAAQDGSSWVRSMIARRYDSAN